MKRTILLLMVVAIAVAPLFAEEAKGETTTQAETEELQATSSTEAYPGMSKVPKADRERVMAWIRLQAVKDGVLPISDWVEQKGGDASVIANQIPETWEPDAEELREAEFQLKMSRKGDEPRRETPKMRELKMPPTESAQPPENSVGELEKTDTPEEQ
ncbi:MAG: hypothetical protein ACP5G4_06890 [bacterium]